MFDLEKLWKKRLRVIFQSIAAGERSHREIASIASHIGADYHGRFLIELLQNACDQAKKAGLHNSTITIIRTEQCIAVTNQGEPFTEPGIEEITSLGLSSKDPQIDIGNKGFGFKAVFQITEEPEIYSSTGYGESFRTVAGNHFGLNRRVFQTRFFREQVTAFAEDSLRRTPELADEIRATTGCDDVLAAILAEVAQAAPFKFPIPLAEEHLRRRLYHLGLPPGREADSQTLIVLPMFSGEETQRVVNDAFEELFQSNAPAVLFLDGVGRIEVVDRVRRVNIELLRQPISQVETLNRGAVFQVCTTWITDLEGDGHTTDWWVLYRDIGASDADERAAVAKAAAELPGENWQKVSHARVAVALQHPDKTLPAGTPLDANGLFCIGLPTTDRTGTPFWIDGRFHANISRTGIDLTKSYNRLLFEESVKLVEDLVERLKIDDDIDRRRAVTQAMTCGDGPLADTLQQCGIAESKIILGRDGSDFVAPKDLSLPERADSDMFNTLSGGQAEDFGFILADSALMLNARELLDKLAHRPQFTFGPDQRFLKREEGGKSLLEFGCSRLRAAGPGFWEPFFDWLLKRFSSDALKDQTILPVGDGELVSPGSRVFFRPWSKTAPSGQSEEDVASEDIPADLANALLFLDERALLVRDPSGTNLTPLARRLAIDGGTQSGLVRRPRRLELLNDLIAPRLADVAGKPEQQSTALGILRLAVTWSQALSDSARAQLRSGTFRVPVKSTEAVWSWVAPRGVYFGDNWLDPETDRLLKTAYGDQPERRLVEWTDFAAACGSGQDERWFWINGLQCLEVNRAPQIRKAPRGRPAPLCSFSYRELSPVYGATSPWPELASLYQDYIETIRKRPANTKTGQTFDVKELTWIDGLENEETRPAVVDLMLRTPLQYEQYTETLLQRSDGSDATQVPSFWAHCLTTNEWAVVPTERGLRAVTKCWLLEMEQATKLRKRYALLDTVSSRYREAQRLLTRLGARWLNDAPAYRLIEALHDIADALGNTRGVHQQKTIEALVEDLYARLNRRGEARLLAESFTAILTRPVPLKRGERMVAVDITKEDCIFFDDEPNRSRFIPLFSEKCCVPVATRSGIVDLLAAFRDVLGDARVVRTSEAAIDTGFTPDLNTPDEPLQEYVKRQFPETPTMVDLGLVMALAGRDPSTEDFKRVWSRLTNAVLTFGHFPVESRTVVFCERAELANPNILASTLASKYQVLAAVWPIVGAAARYILAAYAAAVETNARDAFFADNGVGPVERENIESALGMVTPGPFEHLRSALFAIWRRRSPKAPIEEFQDQWKTRARKSAETAEWIGCHELRELLDQPQATDIEGQNLEILRTAGISIFEWQEARFELGEQPWQFEKSIKLYSQVRALLTATLMVVAARSATTDLAAANEVLEKLRSGAIPESVGHDVMGWQAALVAIVDLFIEMLSRSDTLEVLLSRVHRLRLEKPDSLDEVVFGDVPRREVDTYIDRPAPLREQDAREVVSNVLKVAGALGTLLGEPLDTSVVRTDDRVTALSSGWWSNRFTVLYALRRSLERVAPKTASRMSEQMVFHAPRPWQAYWDSLPELGPVVADAPAPPEPKKELLGVQLTRNEVITDLAKASAGKLGQALSAAAKRSAAPGVLRNRQHNQAMLPERRVGGGTRTSIGRSGTAHPNADNELTGILGEGFVFEYLKECLPEFDESCWRSTNRKAYGLADTGRDDLGYDFEYTDLQGCLTGRTDRPCCYIEVKATSGDGTEAFPITVNEWEMAQRCHDNPRDTVYLIIRVEHVGSQTPRVWEILIDPIQLWTQKEIAISHHDLWVYVGRPIHTEVPPGSIM